MKLISMTDFVLEIKNSTPEVKNFSGFSGVINYEKESYQKILNYAEFLKQPLTLGMFVRVMV